MTVHNRYDSEKHYDRQLWHSNRILQSAELNELQSAMHERLARLGNTVHAEGDITSGGQCVRLSVSEGEGVATWLLEAGSLYLRGAVRSVPERQLTTGLSGTTTIGVYLHASIVTAVEDESLYNPAEGTRGYGLPGADREKITAQWGLEGDGQAGDFFPVYTVVDGNLQPRRTNQADDVIGRAIERYDIESAGGTYISAGLELQRRPDTPEGQQLYNLTAGSARINGKRVDVPTDRRIAYPAAPDLQWVDSEPHSSGTEQAQTIKLHNAPIVGQVQIRIQTRKTATVVHGGFAGVADPLPHQAVVLIESVTQGGTTYQQGTDWQLQAGQVDWSLEGAEPAPGSTYQVVYQCMEHIAPTDQTSDSVTFSGALKNTAVYISYHFALRRYDRLLLDRDGKTSWQRGVPAVFSPVLPAVPSGYLGIASVYQSWDSKTRVIADGVRLVPMQRLHDYEGQFEKIFVDLAETRLAVDISGRYSGIKKGIYADPMIDNSMRDAGAAQTAAIFGGALQLDSAVEVFDLSQGTLSVAHGTRPIISQTRITGQMLINPYNAFGVLPTELTLQPAVYRYSETVEEKLPAQSGRIVDSRANLPWHLRNAFTINRNPSSSRGGRVEWIEESRTSEELSMMRSIDVAFAFTALPGESMESLTFDGVPVTPHYNGQGQSPVAGPDGLIRGAFTIPENTPAGAKEVHARGSGGSYASATFVGSAVLERRIMRAQVVDPLAQTFHIEALTQCCGVHIWAVAAGGPITVQLRDVEAGVPGPNVLAQNILKIADVRTDGTPTAARWSPVTLQPGQSYCVVLLCGDATSAVRIAELGAGDITTSSWVTAQPYGAGVLLSSSNNQSWTAHQGADLTFELLAPQYTADTAEHVLGQIGVTDCTDLVIRAAITAPSAGASGVFRIVLDDLKTNNTPASYQIAAGQPLRLPQRYSGKVSVSVLLAAAEGVAAVLEDGVTLLAGSLKTSGDYISPWLNADAAGTSEVRVVFEADIPAGGSVTVHMQTDSDGDWTVVPYQSSSAQTTGALEIVHHLGDIQNTARLRLKLLLGGEHAARPQVRNLRAVVM